METCFNSNLSKIKIFYTDSGKEIKESLERYFRFVKNKYLDESCFINLSEEFDKENYFNIIYPAAFDGCDLYFIFDRNLNTFKEKNILTESGLIFSMIVDLSISKENTNCYKYEINLIKEDLENYKMFNGISLQDEEQKESVSHFTQIKKGIRIKDYKELINNIIGHHLHELKEDKIKEMKVRLNKIQLKSEQNKKDKSQNEKKCNSIQNELPLFKPLIKKSVFVLLIDDVLGDYNKTFLPFYAFIKSQLRGKTLIMRGLNDPLPEKLSKILPYFPSDIILVDIDFKELGEKKWEDDIRYTFYFTEGKNIAGVKLFEALLSFKQTPIFTKKGGIKIFSGINELKEEIEAKGFFKDENGLKNLCKLMSKTAFYFRKVEDIFKKLVYLRKYIERSSVIEKIIWKTIALEPIPRKVEKEVKEFELVKDNWSYFQSISEHKSGEIYTGLEDIKFNGELKPIIGDRIEQVKGEE